MPIDPIANQLPNLISIPKGYTPLNEQGLNLANLAAWHHEAIGHSGILAAYPESASTQPVGSASNPIINAPQPWVDEPPGAIPFDEQGALSLTTPTPGVDQVVLTMVVPQGYDGCIKYISNAVTDPNFIDGSGELIWKILINGRPVRNFGNITVRKGTMAQGRVISPIRIFPGDVVTYTVQFAAGTLTGQTVCSLTGYFYPSRGTS